MASLVTVRICILRSPPRSTIGRLTKCTRIQSCHSGCERRSGLRSLVTSLRRRSASRSNSKFEKHIRMLGTTGSQPTPPSQDESNSSTNSPPLTSDPPILTWVDRYLPAKFHPYARLARVDKPIGTWLLLWPCFWSTALATPAGHLPDPHLLSLFAVGAFVMRGAGCTINDMWDHELDKKVHRTKSRPLAQGDLNHQQALGFLAVQLSVGLGVLVSLPHTLYCFMWGASSLPLVVAYPLMKRYTNWPQAVLGLTFNWGAWMGWAATYGVSTHHMGRKYIPIFATFSPFLKPFLLFVAMCASAFGM